MEKSDIINSINKIKNNPIAEGKKEPVSNSSGTKHKDLMRYNALLDNITIGAHTTCDINYAGVDWKFRLLTAEEYVNIRIDINKSCRDNELFDDFFVNYNAMIKILSKALTPSPFKTEGKAIFSEDDLKLINYDVLEELYIQYLDFSNMATRKPAEFTAEEVEAFVNIAKKKPEALREFDRRKLLVTTNWFINYSKNLEQMLKSDSTS